MADEKIIHHPPECDRDCADDMCPYVHRDTWEVNGQHYSVEADALAAIGAAVKKG